MDQQVFGGISNETISSSQVDSGLEGALNNSVYIGGGSGIGGDERRCAGRRRAQFVVDNQNDVDFVLFALSSRCDVLHCGSGKGEEVDSLCWRRENAVCLIETAANIRRC